MPNTNPAGRNAAFADQALSLLFRALRHPATATLLHRALRVATRQVVKAIQNKRRTRAGHIHIS
jgi:hypothetical protein